MPDRHRRRLRPEPRFMPGASSRRTRVVSSRARASWCAGRPRWGLPPTLEKGRTSPSACTLTWASRSTDGGLTARLRGGPCDGPDPSRSSCRDARDPCRPHQHGDLSVSHPLRERPECHPSSRIGRYGALYPLRVPGMSLCRVGTDAYPLEPHQVGGVLSPGFCSRPGPSGRSILLASIFAKRTHF